MIDPSRSLLGLLAQESRLDSLGSALRRAMQTGPTMIEILVLVGAVALLAGVVYAVIRFSRRENETPEQTPQDHLAQALAVLSLSAGERRDLRFVAEQSRMEEPVAMLLSPANYTWAVDAAAVAGLGDAAQSQRLRDLQTKLFG